MNNASEKVGALPLYHFLSSFMLWERAETGEGFQSVSTFVDQQSFRVAPLMQIDSFVLYVEPSTKSTENVCKSRELILISTAEVLVIWKPARCNPSPPSPQMGLRNSF